MIGVVVALLLAAAVAGVLVARRGARGPAGLAWAAVPAVLVGAAAVVALAAPATSGFGLAAVRVAAVLAAMAGGSALVTAAFALAGATGEDEPAGESESEAETAPADGTDAPTPDGSEGSPDGDETRRAGGAPNDEPRDEPVPASPLRGGLAIGVLERAAIAVCVLANFGGGLAVIIAAKGLARYPELRHPGAAEQFIIGTFVSVLWAVACTGVAVALGR
ncbi:hypothetical protein [Tsukamurella ocularis]|uniref:hypothetical protein n=1 Tax=Tsukamurella ocularis TaxID=1970234 RepID=UPI00216946A8|nr:hypothetical protein [Tsukamurella ocularis]MCS3779822.1 hypothetical protein [Tsukamurella ocularis]MCS3788778.1 hypothetical protein [Tsukamurella ocularis]MCS3849988.1 hypothetical protein [Tsukamurella ocularis]